MARRRKGITPRRMLRLVDEVAPLMVQGLSAGAIGRRLGLTPSIAEGDVRAVKKLWEEKYLDSRDQWAGRFLATYEWLISECAGAWEQSKQGRITRVINPDGTELVRQEPPDPRWLSGMLAVTKEASTYLGIREGADTVARVEVADSTRHALAPMSADAYMAMLASTNGMPAINAVPPVSRREADAEAESAEVIDMDVAHDQQSGGPSGDGGSGLPRFIPRA